MRIGIISGVIGLFVTLSVHAQKSDSIKSMLLPDVVVTETYQQRQAKKSALTVDVADQDFLRKHFTGNFMQAMENIPGVQAMDIGSGFSKPMIRGMGFNRIAVLENGIKQEGQQWGADHGLELDAFNIGAVNVLKGPSSLLYGSDAMGGVIDVVPPAVPVDNRVFGDVTLLGKSVNGTVGGSLMLGIKKNAWYSHIRYSEQHFGDYHIPTDSIVYLTQRIRGEGDLIDRLMEMNIAPLAISYEYDPCDFLKAQEFQLKRDIEGYKKTTQDDLINMQTGLFGYKGRVHFQVAPCLNDDLKELDRSLPKPDLFARISACIDRRIHRNYRIYPGNYVAYDWLNGTTEFVSNYTEEEKQQFMNYIEQQLAKIKIPNKDEDFLREKLLLMYSNPLVNYLAACR